MDWKKIFLPIFIVLFFLSIFLLPSNMIGGCGKLSTFLISLGFCLFFLIISLILLLFFIMRKQLVFWLVLMYSFLLLMIVIWGIFVGVKSYTALMECPVLNDINNCRMAGGEIFSNTECPKNYVELRYSLASEGICCMPIGKSS